MKPKIRVLYSEGCSHLSPTIALIREVAEDLAADVDLRAVPIREKSEALKRRFLGSPTIQVNGKDIDPAAAALEFSGFA